MEVLAHTGKIDLAQIYVARMRDDLDYLVEFVDACDRNAGDRREKWVIIISTQFGCPVKCLMCDAGGEFKGNLKFEELVFQVQSVIDAHPELAPHQCGKFKIQFARMGEPSLNDEVLKVLSWIHESHPKAIPCIATMLPRGREQWFDKLLTVRERFHDFQLQFSINSTDDSYRDILMPYPKMSWHYMAEYVKDFYRQGQRKVCLNFALCPEIPVNPEAARDYFDPEFAVIKLTPLNPTITGQENRMTSMMDSSAAEPLLARKSQEFARLGFSVIQSIGNMDENLIGSNCGQAVRKLRSYVRHMAVAS